jgi:hypothetical protein
MTFADERCWRDLCRSRRNSFPDLGGESQQPGNDDESNWNEPSGIKSGPGDSAPGKPGKTHVISPPAYLSGRSAFRLRPSRRVLSLKRNHNVALNV